MPRFAANLTLMFTEHAFLDRFAAAAEAELRGEPAPDAVIAAEIAPCFVEDGARRTDAVVLGCTELPLAIGAGPRLSAVIVDTIDALALTSIAWARTA